MKDEKREELARAQGKNDAIFWCGLIIIALLVWGAA